jgi:hypothetical protein
MNFTIYLLGQNNIGNERAIQSLESAVRLTKITTDSWDRLWDNLVTPEEPLWQALVQLGGFIAALSLIWLLVQKLSHRELNQSSVIEILQFPFAIAILLSGNGFLIAGLAKATRNISLYWLTRILNFTIAGITIDEALQKQLYSNVADSRARQIFSECVDQVGTALEDCVQDPAKIAQANDLLLEITNGNIAPLRENLLEKVAGNFLESINFVSITFVNAIQFVLNILQWGVVNLVEVAILLDVLFLPIALGFSLVPGSKVSLAKWFAGYVSLLLIPLGYVIIVGLVGVVLALTEQEGQPLGSRYVDLAFLLFMSTFAPWTSYKISKGVGDEIFEGVSSSAKASIQAAGGFATSVAKLTLGMK